MSFYADCVLIINEGDMLSKLELLSTLYLNQRDPFYEMEVISNSAINSRLDYVLSNDRL